MLFTPPTTQYSMSSTGNTVNELSDFASNMVYLMWHARKPIVSDKSWSPSLLQNNNNVWQTTNSYYASPAFKKFCFQVLTATQLSESAVYLSLKYIAILLQSNPTIEGAEGSEYRLFIVALMLANKFLDDNTFTNKTWSEVSGMKIKDVNIMESEFLEALDYNLFVRSDDYNIWKQLLQECRQRATLSYYDHPQQRQQLVMMTLETLGLSCKWYDATRLQLENSQKRYQYFLHQQQKLPNYYPPITNLSQSSWDPLAYSLNRCQDYSSSYYSFDSTRPPISWGNYY